jgi:hypothetical protein
MRHELDLLANAIDSLNEALAKYQQGKAGDERAYKFCVLHLMHFLELVLKHYVTLSHPLLIYKNPFARDFTDDSQTIGMQDAINFLKNEGKDLPQTFLEDLHWLKKLRNRIEHHKFDMDVEEVDGTVGRLIQAVVTFDRSHRNLGLETRIDPAHFRLFLVLADNYRLNLDRALREAADAEEAAYEGYRNKERYLVNLPIVECDHCGHETMAPASGSSTGYRCTFCGEEKSDAVPVGCGVCGDDWEMGEMVYTEWHEHQPEIYVCPRCRRDPMYVKDD